MGEYTRAEDCIAISWTREAACLEDDYLPALRNIVCLQSFGAKTLKYVQVRLLVTNECTFHSTSKRVSMVRSMDGEGKL